LLLAIDTSTKIAGIALYDQGGLHTEQMWRTVDNHTVELMPYVVRACQQQDLEPTALKAVAIATGPGSFTGLRVGLSVAKGLALAMHLPILGVPTLDASAYAHSRETIPVRAVLPAGRGRWCSALYQRRSGNWQRCSDYDLLDAKALVASFTERTLICGETNAALMKLLRESVPTLAVIASPALALRRAGFLAELAWQRFVNGDQDELSSLHPIYLQHA
jgi:tRNA threonylcarbamoyladenosine biosynthesis protein TsaB